MSQAVRPIVVPVSLFRNIVICTVFNKSSSFNATILQIIIKYYYRKSQHLRYLELSDPVALNSDAIQVSQGSMSLHTMTSLEIYLQQAESSPTFLHRGNCIFRVTLLIQWEARIHLLQLSLSLVLPLHHVNPRKRLDAIKFARPSASL